MKKIFLISLLLITPILTSKTLGQDSVHLYTGVNINGFGTWDELFGGDLEMGFGVDVGVKYNIFYLGAEYGIFGLIISRQTRTFDPGISYEPYDELPNLQQYFGLHGGIIIKKQFWIGAVFLWSTTTVNHFTFDGSHTRSMSQFQGIWFNVGPDLRWNTSEHLTLDFAYTIRRGLKLGAAYVF